MSKADDWDQAAREFEMETAEDDQDGEEEEEEEVVEEPTEEEVRLATHLIGPISYQRLYRNLHQMDLILKKGLKRKVRMTWKCHLQRRDHASQSFPSLNR